ncbi:unnamed protein product [Calypogeia fissa]
MAGKSVAPLGGEPVEGQAVVGKKKRDYKVTNRLQEGKRPLYAITFNFIDSRFFTIFASAGANRVTVYQCLEGGPIAVLQAYVDEDVRTPSISGPSFAFNWPLCLHLIFFVSSLPLVDFCCSDLCCARFMHYLQKDESFYTVSWACDNEGLPLLVASGSNGVIRVIDCSKENLLKTLVGHGDSVNELRTQALKPCLVISASKDESIRLWNVTTNVCILVMAGAGGHRNEVLSVDFHPSDMHQIASCGMDNTIKLWNIKDFWVWVEKSFTWTESPSKFPTKYVQFPVFNALVHSNYVDCTRWLGDFILSKSVDNEIVVWEPLLKEHSGTEGAVDVLQKYPVPECDIWFIKFSCDFHFNTLAIGNREGKVFVWEPQSSPPNLLAKLSHSQCKSPVRQTATSFDGSTILCCCEDGSIWRWDGSSASTSN